MLPLFTSKKSRAAILMAALFIVAAIPVVSTAQTVTRNSSGTIEIVGTGQADIVEITVGEIAGPNSVIIIANSVVYRFDWATSLEIWGRGGADDITLHEVYLSDHLIVRCDAGADNLTVRDILVVEGDVDIDLGDGDNDFQWDFRLRKMEILGDWTMRFGRNDDFVFNNAMSARLTIQGNVDIELGSGENRCSPGAAYYAPLVCAGSVSIFGDDGIDRITLKGSRIHGEVLIDAGDGDNELQVNFLQQRGGMTIMGGKDDDQLTISEPQIRGQVNVFLGDGNDDFTFSGLNYIFNMNPFYEAEPSWLNVNMGNGDNESTWNTHYLNFDIEVSHGLGNHAMDIVDSNFVRPIAVEAVDDLTLHVERTLFEAPLQLNVHAGSAWVWVNECQFLTATNFAFASRRDALFVESSQFFEPLHVEMGRGDDAVVFQDTQFFARGSYSMRIDGGQDYDTLDYSSIFGPPQRRPLLDNVEQVTGL